MIPILSALLTFVAASRAPFARERRAYAAAVALAMPLVASAAAQPASERVPAVRQPSIEATLAVARVAQDGRLTEVPVGGAGTVVPGDVLEYRSRVVNLGRAEARDVEPTLPIPAGTVFVPGSATPPTAASLDGKSFAAIPLLRRTIGADGRARDVEVPSSEYRAVRWSVAKLAPGSEVVVRARVRVASTESAPATRIAP